MTEQFNKGRPILYILVPCYNEQKVLPITAPMFLKELLVLVDSKRVSEMSKIMFINDGSSDNTWGLITELAQNDPHFIGISQSRNRGHQNAVLAGMMEAADKCDITISIDCDGQDDIHAMEEMVDEYLNGSEVVYGVRNNRDSDSFFKKFTAESFYRFINAMGADVVFNHADYRLISSRVLEEFKNYGEVNIFLRGLFPLIGFKSSKVYYAREKRMAGESHYPLKKMLQLAFDGITSLSIKPLTMITGLGITFSFIGFLGIIWAIVEALVGNTVIGWASAVCIICFLGGLQLLSLGVIGQYIGKIYLETKQRPRFIISDRTWEPYQRQYKG